MNGAPYMMLPGARLYVENGELVESLGYISGPQSGPPGPLEGCSPCASGSFTGGVGNLLVLGLAVFGGFYLWKKYK